MATESPTNQIAVAFSYPLSLVLSVYWASYATVATSCLFICPDVFSERIELDHFFKKKLALDSKDLVKASIVLYNEPHEL